MSLILEDCTVVLFLFYTFKMPQLDVTSQFVLIHTLKLEPHINSEFRRATTSLMSFCSHHPEVKKHNLPIIINSPQHLFIWYFFCRSFIHFFIVWWKRTFSLRGETGLSVSLFDNGVHTGDCQNKHLTISVTPPMFCQTAFKMPYKHWHKFRPDFI